MIKIPKKAKIRLGSAEKDILSYLSKQKTKSKTTDIAKNTPNRDALWEWQIRNTGKNLSKKGLISMKKDNKGIWKYNITQKGRNTLNKNPIPRFSEKESDLVSIMSKKSRLLGEIDINLPKKYRKSKESTFTTMERLRLKGLVEESMSGYWEYKLTEKGMNKKLKLSKRKN